MKISSGEEFSEGALNNFRTILEDLKDEGLDTDTAEELLKGTSVYDELKFQSEINSLRELSKIHDVSGYQHEYNNIDHVFKKEGFAYEVKSVTWNTAEHQEIMDRMRRVLDHFESTGKHVQVMFDDSDFGEGSPTVLTKPLPTNSTVRSYTEGLYTPTGFVSDITERAVDKAEKKVSDLRKFEEGHRLVILDVTTVYVRVNLLRRKLHKRARVSSLGDLDGVLLMINEPTGGTELDTRLEPVIWSDELSHSMYKKIRPDEFVIPQSIYSILINSENRNENYSNSYFLKQRNGKHIVNEEVETKPLIEEWAIMGVGGKGEYEFEFEVNS